MYSVFTADRKDAKHLPKNSNLVNYSMFKELQCKVPFRGFSIKYVVEGCEKYQINGRPYAVGAGSYLLANHHSEGYALLEGKQLVKGVCIDLNTEMLSEVVASHRRPDTPVADLDLGQFFSSTHFLENQYHAEGTATGQVLKALGHKLSKNPFYQHQFDNELFYALAEAVVADHRAVLGELKGIPATKSETKKELYRRVQDGRAFIDLHFTEELDLEAISRAARMSDYHFFRIFKAVFKKSPYQYLLQKRLAFATTLLTDQGASITDAAIESGFSDIYSFSKSFKKHFGLPPSAIVPK